MPTAPSPTVRRDGHTAETAGSSSTSVAAVAAAVLECNIAMLGIAIVLG